MTRWNDSHPTSPAAIVYVLGWNLVGKRVGTIPFHVGHAVLHDRLRCGLQFGSGSRFVPVRLDIAQALGRPCVDCAA